jgi:hypothetical protein
MQHSVRQTVIAKLQGVEDEDRAMIRGAGMKRCNGQTTTRALQMGMRDTRTCGKANSTKRFGELPKCVQRTSVMLRAEKRAA